MSTPAFQQHPSPPTILDAFAGPGGWDVGAAIIGIPRSEILGVEINAAAAAAATAAGHQRVLADILDINPADYPHTTGFICSSPCPTFSSAGLRSGTADLQIILDAITHAGSVDCECPWEDIAEELIEASDPRTALAAQSCLEQEAKSPKMAPTNPKGLYG